MQNPAHIYLDQVQSKFSQIDTSQLDALIDVLFSAYQRQATVFTFGNGASAALASHLACDLGKGPATDLSSGVNTRAQPRLRIVSLTDNTALMTAYGNDLDYADVFLEQLKGLLRPGDVALAVSGSGGSPNVLRGLEYARSAGAINTGLTGRQPAAERMLALCDVCVQAPSEMMEQIEDFHVIFGHVAAVTLRHLIASALQPSQIAAD